MTFVYFTDRDLGIAFPQILRDAGLTVERHRDHFPPDCPDERWLAEVGRRAWIALSHNRRIRYTPNEQAAVTRHHVRLLIMVGKAPLPELAAGFVATRTRVEAFLQRRSPPCIAKVYRARPEELAADPRAPGRVECWYPR